MAIQHPLEARVKKQIASSLQDILTQHDTKMAKVYEGHRSGKTNDWMDAKKAYDIGAQLRYDIDTFSRSLVREGVAK